MQSFLVHSIKTIACRFPRRAPAKTILISLQCIGMLLCWCTQLRDWLLITNGEGFKTGGGQVKFYPYEKGGGVVDKVLAMLKGGGGVTQSFGVVFMR